MIHRLKRVEASDKFICIRCWLMLGLLDPRLTQPCEGRGLG